MLANDSLTRHMNYAVRYLSRPVRLFQEYDRKDLKPDLIAGITVGVIALPQAIAFSIIAELPPEMGLYAIVVATLFGALWGSSHQMMTGPANAISLLIFSVLTGVAAVGSSEYIIAAGLMAVMVGVFQMAMGLARLGILANFVSHSVIIGFSSGAGILIVIKQLQPLLNVDVSSNNVLGTLIQIVQGIPETHLPSATIGGVVIILILLLRAVNRKLPGSVIAILVGSALVYLFRLDQQGVATVGQLPASLPPLARLPLLNLDFIARLSTGALAVGAIGLVETAAIARSMSAQTGQKLESNQEFVGQGMANIMAGLFSGYASAGSFSRSAVNLSAGAKTSMSAIISALFVLVAMFALAPLAVYLPMAGLAGVLIVTGFRLVDHIEIRRLLDGTTDDAIIMAVTLLGTLFLKIEFAVLLGIMLSFAMYIRRTSTPRVAFVKPDENFRHFVHDEEKPDCPQLGVIEIQGDLYFGAVSYIEEVVQDHLDKHPEERYLLVRMHSINQVDFSGLQALEEIVRTYRERGGDVFLVRVHPNVYTVMRQCGFVDMVGKDHFLDEDKAISNIFHHVLDPAICIYECPYRVFKECQALPKGDFAQTISHTGMEKARRLVQPMTAQTLYTRLQSKNGDTPLVVDVREPREYHRGHIPDAESFSLGKLLEAGYEAPDEREMVFVCRTGRRSRRAAMQQLEKGNDNVYILEGGMQAWESAGYLEAIDYWAA